MVSQKNVLVCISPDMTELNHFVNVTRTFSRYFPELCVHLFPLFAFFKHFDLQFCKVSIWVMNVGPLWQYTLQVSQPCFSVVSSLCDVFITQKLSMKRTSASLHWNCKPYPKKTFLLLGLKQNSSVFLLLLKQVHLLFIDPQFIRFIAIPSHLK